MPPVEQPDTAAYIKGAFRSSGATRTDVLRSAMNEWAPKSVVDQLLELPEGYYRDLDEVLASLP